MRRIRHAPPHLRYPQRGTIAVCSDRRPKSDRIPDRLLARRRSPDWPRASTASSLARQLHGLGVAPRAIRRRVLAGRLHAVHAGVVAVGHPRLTERGRLLAAVLAYEPAAVVSHWSAAAHWGLLPARRGRVEVIAPSSHERVGTRRHRLRLAPGDKTVRGSVPVTSVGRTLADIATVASREALARAVHEAQVRRLLPHPEIERAISRSVNRHSARELRWLLAEVQPEPRLRSSSSVDS